MQESGQQYGLLSPLSNMGYFFIDSGSLLDNGDHTPAQLQEHLFLLGSQAIMIEAQSAGLPDLKYQLEIGGCFCIWL